MGLYGQIDGQQLIEEHMAKYGAYNREALETTMIESSGTYTFFNKTFDFVAYQQKDKLNCKFVLPGFEWNVIENDSVRWFVDPLTDKLIFDAPYELEFESLMRSKDLLFNEFIKQDYSILGVQEISLLDSIPTYLLALKTEIDRYNFYFQKDDYAFVGFERIGVIRKLFLDHQEIEGMLLPRLFIVERNDLKSVLRTEAYKVSTEEPDIFNLPEGATITSEGLEEAKKNVTNLNGLRMLYYESQLLNDAGKYEEAMELIDIGLKKAPDDSGLLNSKGLILFNQGKFEEALNFFEASLAQREENPIAIYNLGLANEELGRMSMAENHFKKAISLAPEKARYHARLGLHFYKKKAYQKSIEAYDKSIGIDPFEESSYYFRGLGYMVTYQDKAAIADFKKAESLGRKSFRLYENLGMVYNHMKDLKESNVYFKKAAELAPDQLYLREAVVYNYLQLDMTKEILEETTAILKLDASKVNMRQIRAFSLFEVQEYDLAEKDFDIVLKELKEPALMWYYRGKINLYQKDYEKAVADFTQYITEDASDFALIDRALAYMELDKKVLGCADLTKAKEMGSQEAAEFLSEMCGK